MRLARACLLGVVIAVASCSAGGGGSSKPIPGAGGQGGDASVLGDSGGQDTAFVPDTSSEASGCASSSYEAKQAPAALLIVLDKSSSMANGNKWAYAGQAIVKAIDQPAYDNMYLGLYAAPTGNVQGPSCIYNMAVPCQAPAFPQIALQLAGDGPITDVNTARGAIYWFVTNVNPSGGVGDASPMYAALQFSISALKDWKETGKRILLLVTDGTLSCNQLSSPARPGFPDCNGCDHDWEDPNNLVQLLDAAQKDPDKPIDSFVVGVPGSDTYDQSGCNYPPYHMRLALSAMAWAGSPANAPANCDGKDFTQAGGDPSLSCHFDMTQGTFDADTLAGIIDQIRGKTLGCTYDLPTPEAGTVNYGLVNVQYSVAGAAMTALLKRADASDACTSDGCWDYDADHKVLLIGKACDDVKAATDAKVEIVVGCNTNVK